jgi:hypothetical protein
MFLSATYDIGSKTVDRVSCIVKWLASNMLIIFVGF